MPNPLLAELREAIEQWGMNMFDDGRSLVSAKNPTVATVENWGRLDALLLRVEQELAGRGEK